MSKCTKALSAKTSAQTDQCCSMLPSFSQECSPVWTNISVHNLQAEQPRRMLGPRACRVTFIFLHFRGPELVRGVDLIMKSVWLYLEITWCLGNSLNIIWVLAANIFISILFGFQWNYSRTFDFILVYHGKNGAITYLKCHAYYCMNNLTTIGHN